MNQIQHKHWVFRLCLHYFNLTELWWKLNCESTKQHKTFRSFAMPLFFFLIQQYQNANRLPNQDKALEKVTQSNSSWELDEESAVSVENTQSDKVTSVWSHFSPDFWGSCDVTVCLVTLQPRLRLIHNTSADNLKELCKHLIYMHAVLTVHCISF